MNNSHFILFCKFFSLKNTFFRKIVHFFLWNFHFLTLNLPFSKCYKFQCFQGFSYLVNIYRTYTSQHGNIITPLNHIFNWRRKTARILPITRKTHSIYQSIWPIFSMVPNSASTFFRPKTKWWVQEPDYIYLCTMNLKVQVFKTK